MSTKTNTTSAESETETTEDDIETEETVVETTVDPEPGSEELEGTDSSHSEPNVGDEEQEYESSEEASPEQTDGTEEDDVEEAQSEREEETISGPPGQFQAALKGGVIRDFVSTLRAIVDEAKLTVTPDGITTRAVDPANVAMYDVQLHSGAFESYDASEGLL
jgi:proliferating cell nuclear antigen